MNIRNFVPNDHVLSPDEIMQVQSASIQAYMLENEQLQKELKKVYDELTSKDKELERYKNIIKLLKHFGENSLGIIYALKDNVEPTENEWLNLIEYEKYLRELKGE